MSSQWEGNETIGVQISGKHSGAAQTPYTAEGQYAVTLAAGNKASVTAVEGRTAYWQSTLPATVTAWYSNHTQEGTVTLSNQTGGLAYVLKAETENCTYNSSVALDFKHQLAKVRVTLTGYTSGVKKVEIMGYTTCTNDKGTVATTGSQQGWITMKRDGSNYVWEANVVPVSTVGGTNLIRLNGKTIATINGITGFKAGEMCKIDLTVYQAGSFVVSTGLASTATYTYNGLQMQIGTWKSDASAEQATLSTVTIAGGKAYFPPTTLQSLKDGDKIWVCIPRVVKFFHTLTQAEVDAKALTLPDKDGGSTLKASPTANGKAYENDWIVALYMGINKYNGTTPTETPLYWATGNLIATKTNAAKVDENADYRTTTAFHIATSAETETETIETFYSPYVPNDFNDISSSGSDGYADRPLGAQWDWFGWGDATGLKTTNQDDDYALSISGGSISGTANDIVRAQLGGSWHMPGKELENMADKLNVSGVWYGNGFKYEYADDNGIANTLLFPAAGSRTGIGGSNRGGNGYYWSGLFSSLDAAYYLYFHDSRASWTDSGRYYGYSVRPVSE
ncbi:hypothetical protein [Bacteroides timonensis]|uniref:hypothetical protein n=1 Tax=Bacteroides timonensis TaxID=1470345 RepID=UPI00069386D2|nr:hypothetical protein [Bacteroides timonensis]